MAVGICIGKERKLCDAMGGRKRVRMIKVVQYYIYIYVALYVGWSPPFLQNYIQSARHSCMILPVFSFLFHSSNFSIEIHLNE